MKNKNLLSFKALSKEEIVGAKGGVVLKPLFRCKREGMNCYGLTEGPCPGEADSNRCP